MNLQKNSTTCHPSFIAVTERKTQELASPHHVLIINAGEQALQSAFRLARSGTLVTILDKEAELLPEEEPSVAYQLKRLFEHLGIRFKLGITVRSIYRSNEGVNLIYTDTKNGLSYCLQADMILTVN